MSILVYRDANLAYGAAASIFASQIIRKPKSVLGLSTGTAPEGIFARLAGMTASGLLDWSDITSFNTAEYMGVGSADPDSCSAFMIRHLFSKVNIDKSKVHFPDGTAEQPEEELRAYEKSVSEAGGIDLLLLCIGMNGRLGFNEPSKEFPTSAHIVELSKSAADPSSRFAGKTEAPQRALTLGVQSFMSAGNIVLIATGQHKADAVYKMLNEPVTPFIPASILQFHPDVTYIFDEAAAERL
jgi:glucosamine-6-phosphate deaminase